MQADQDKDVKIQKLQAELAQLQDDMLDSQEQLRRQIRQLKQGSCKASSRSPKKRWKHMSISYEPDTAKPADTSEPPVYRVNVKAKHSFANSRNHAAGQWMEARSSNHTFNERGSHYRSRS